MGLPINNGKITFETFCLDIVYWQPLMELQEWNRSLMQKGILMAQNILFYVEKTKFLTKILYILI